MYRFIVILVLVQTVFSGGCADVTSITRNTTREVVLDSKAKTYVSVPTDGRYGQQTYKGSGRVAAGIVFEAFSSRMLHVDMADTKEYFDQALNHARSGGYHYLVVPKIAHWEDRNTAWSGRPSKAAINIRIVNVGTGDMVDSVVINSRSSMVRMTDPSPEDALPGPVHEYVNSLVFK